jgi:hypothetical protein
MVARSIGIAAWRFDTDCHHITTARLALDCQIEQRTVPFATFDLQLDGSTAVTWSQRRLGADNFALFQGK